MAHSGYLRNVETYLRKLVRPGEYSVHRVVAEQAALVHYKHLSGVLHNVLHRVRYKQYRLAVFVVIFLYLR